MLIVYFLVVQELSNKCKLLYVLYFFVRISFFEVAASVLYLYVRQLRPQASSELRRRRGRNMFRFHRLMCRSTGSYVAAAFNSLFFFVCTRIYSVIFALFSFISLSRNQYFVRFFCIILFCFQSLFVCVCSRLFVHFHCDATVIKFIYRPHRFPQFVFPLSSHTMFVSIAYLRLVGFVSFVVFVHNLLFILFVATARPRRLSPFNLYISIKTRWCDVLNFWLHYCTLKQDKSFLGIFFGIYLRLTRVERPSRKFVEFMDGIRLQETGGKTLE